MIVLQSWYLIIDEYQIVFFSWVFLCYDFWTHLFVELQGLGLKLGVDFTFAWDNHNHNENHNNHNNIPHLNFLKGTVLGDKEQGVGIKVKGKGIRDKK